MIQFILNRQHISTDLPAGSTVLDFVRYHKRLRGTKIGCREGDCGACTVLVGDFENATLRYRSMTSCLMPLGNAHGKHIVTVEGINGENLSPVQEAMVACQGTQCGFCTIGFVMSLTGFAMDTVQKDYENAIASIDGNVCRCTGYKSIERAAALICEQIAEKPAHQTLEWLAQNNFIPDYFVEIPQRLATLQEKLSAQNKNSTASSPVHLNIGGGTDLIVQKHHAVKHAPLELLYEHEDFQQIRLNAQGNCEVGASVTVTEWSESPLIQSFFSDLKRYVKMVSSTPIRNMATLAGNVVNASPIGDMSVFLLVLETDVHLKNKEGKARKVALKNFYKAYKTLDKTPDEVITHFEFVPPPTRSVFNFEKVSKRTYLDIASVNSAFSATLSPDGNAFEQVHLSAGGVAPFPKYLRQTCDFLTGKNINTANLKTALAHINEEIAPISDARGTADYKRLLLRQLVLCHWQHLPAAQILIKELL